MRISHYVILEKISEGRMGIINKAFDIKNDQIFPIKILKDSKRK